MPSSRLIVACALLWAMPAHTAPTGGQITAGAGAITQAGGDTTVQQASQHLSLNWQSFDVGAHESVNYLQPDSAAIAVNRIGGTSASQILGSLNANGQVFLINPNGILFGVGAQVNVGGLVASTLNINDRDLNAATRQFAGGGLGTIVNHGTITTPPGGYVALLGRQVSNQGTIRTPGGTVALGAGNAVSLSFDATRLLSMQIDQSVLTTLAENKQLLVAEGGQVLMSAGARDSLLASVVNNTGVIQAQTLANHKGRIVLLAGMATGTTEVAGTLDASAPDATVGDGGFIETSGARVRVADGARITSHAANGHTGQWLIDPQDYTIAASSGDITGSALSQHLGSSNITLISSGGGAAGNGDIHVNDAVSWGANTLTLTAANHINLNAVLTASGNAGLALNTGTANGVDAGVAGGTVNAMPGTGRVDFPGRSGSGFLTINGQGYTVLDSLGAPGDVTSGAATLQGMAATANLAGHYALGSDIDASATGSWNGGAGFEPIGNTTTLFSGSFDGLGHTISGVFINRPGLDRVGLFGAAMNPEIRNIGLIGVNVVGHSSVGGLIGLKNGGELSNSYATGQVTSQTHYGGGLVGANLGSIRDSYATASVSAILGAGGLAGYNAGSIDNSYATGQITGTDWYTGGLVGGNVGGTISNSYAIGPVSGVNGVGGLVGYNELSSSSISNSFATGNVNATANDAGGLAGGNKGTISNSYATGQVSGNTVNVAGLVGIQVSGSISQSYATGAVHGPNAVGTVGGLVGRQDGGTVSTSYWNTETTGQAHSTGSADSFGLSSADMRHAGSYAGWDLATTGASTAAWRIYEGQTTPLLRAFMTPLTVTAQNVTSPYTGVAYPGSNAYTFSHFTPSIWHPSSSVDTGLLIGSANTNSPAIDIGTYTLSRGPRSGQMGYDITFVPGTLGIEAATVPPLPIPTEIPRESLPNAVRTTIAGLTQEFTQPDSDEPATRHWQDASTDQDGDAPERLTIVGSGVRLP